MKLKLKKKEIEKMFKRLVEEYQIKDVVLDWGDAYAVYSSYNKYERVIRMSQVIIKQITLREAEVHLLRAFIKCEHIINGKRKIEDSLQEKREKLYELYQEKVKGVIRIELKTRYEAVCPACGRVHKRNVLKRGNMFCGKCPATPEKSRLVYKRVN